MLGYGGVKFAYLYCNYLGKFMEYLSDECSVLMGELHNKLVVLVDDTRLTPPEVIIVLRMMANNIERLFETSVKGKG